jgi:glucose-6-phosphate isomerase
MTRTIHNHSAVEHPSWEKLESHHKVISKLHLRELFADDPKRAEEMAIDAVGLYLDYSKNLVTEETLFLLLQLAKEAGLRARIDAMFRGEKINLTEKRAVLHTALRAPKGTSIVVDGRRRCAESPRRTQKNG